MIIKRFVFPVHPHGQNSYIVACEKTREAVMIDVGDFSEEIIAFLKDRNLTLRYILLTHAHGDHVGGVKRLKDLTGAEVFFDPRDESTLRRAQESLQWDYDGLQMIDHTLKEGDTIHLGTLTFTVFDTPGHTPGSISFLSGNALFVGDALFAGSVGGTPDYETFTTQVTAIKGKLFPLGDHIEVYNGHGPSTTLGIERLFNPFLD
ncbi:MAG: MBL fold metallo-hydrolase [Candidatus Tectomicrobia bacterium]|nr:MBL fold metallo-hydrolase [Candidatus Tectomicrobia bacterium]